MKLFPMRNQKGLAAVEMAITAPLLLFVMFATAELGRVWMQYNTLTKSVRDGVRYVASNAIPDQLGLVNLTPETISDAQNLVVYGNVVGSGSPLLPALDTGSVSVAVAGDDDIVVTASYAYQPMNPIIPGFGVGPDRDSIFLLEAQATMRAL